MEDAVQKHNISEEDITIIFNQAVNWKYYLSPPFMKQRLESDADLREVHEHFLSIITKPEQFILFVETCANCLTAA